MTTLPGPLVDGAWLAGHLDAGDLRVLEATVYLDPGTPYTIRSGRPEWESSHIAGSAFADLVHDLAQPHPTLNFTFPSPDRFAAGMSALGVEDGTAVVIYDRNGTMWATRLWWLLRAYGFDNAAVLDGGWHAWEGPLSDDPAPAPAGAHFTPRPRPELIASIDEVAAGPPCLINALAPDVFSGERDRYGRSGRIPGSANVYSRHLLDPATGQFLPEAQLREQLGEFTDERVVVYCGAGISATIDAFALTLLGARDVAVYDGSMSEWISDPARPLDFG